MRTEELRKEADKYIINMRNNEELSQNSFLQYQRAINAFFEYLEENEIESVMKRTVLDYKAEMIESIEKYTNTKAKPNKGERPVTSYNTLNIRIRALNRFFDAIGVPELKVNKEKVETSNTNAKAMSERDYLKLIEYIDKAKDERLRLIVETLAGTGIRIGELKAITVDSLRDRTPEVRNKGKVRTIFIPEKLAQKLRAYCKKEGITEGIIFSNRKGDGMIHPTYIRSELKKIAGKARMKKSIVFPHNFRHLFAQRYADMPGSNPFALADLLGHSNGNGAPNSVTALYTRPNAKKLLKEIDKLENYVNTTLLPEAQKERNRSKRRAEINKANYNKRKKNSKGNKKK